MSVAAEAIANYWQTHATEATRKKSLFLQGLQEYGTVKHAAVFAQINRITAYQWRNIDPEFRQAWDLVLEDVTDEVESSLYRQAVSEKNVVATIFYLKHNRAKYREETRIIVAREVDETIDRAIAAHQLPTALEPCEMIETTATVTDCLPVDQVLDDQPE